ncbi:hypothetical protein [Paenibacillus radicis (ex Xue et al. 2023)]|uniref:Uncharacterized protein n=1 Tax=Paenibacillus radicis (ex Xue et al. 2023) TaxID=2972489 RepID=A0ABT1YQY5_9BACL|nr:hypothetical protein [Paenibacillus radicis (ex Xue et al. 2023)]MCR8634693.1 hypothetical protein [Paenibacillus radicis (ex Xue et al. 2023)]
MLDNPRTLIRLTDIEELEKEKVRKYSEQDLAEMAEVAEYADEMLKQAVKQCWLIPYKVHFWTVKGMS